MSTMAQLDADRAAPLPGLRLESARMKAFPSTAETQVREAAENRHTLIHRGHEGTRKAFAVFGPGRSAGGVFSNPIFSNPKGSCFWAGAGLPTGIGSCR